LRRVLGSTRLGSVGKTKEKRAARGRVAGAGGGEAFGDYYAALFGERWPVLEAALAAASDPVAFVAGAGLDPYYLDSASIFAASCLELRGPDPGVVLDATGASSAGGLILDACAAPGGKSLVLASRLPPGAKLVANELSADRRRRLRDVLDRHLPPETRSRVEVTGRDAAAMCRAFESSFDAILLDAPCSSERHVLADAAALSEWRPARIRGLASRQWALLSSALIMLKRGGRLVYSTCALSPRENDCVVARAVEKFGAGISVERISPPAGAELTEYGLSILPDRAGGAGPMYVCRIGKIL
jgi:16S rRNA C967 or C1407 C5-methylase (RsmB/RsmF family)